MSSIAQRRILADIKKAQKDTSFKFICDDDGKFGEVNVCYIAFNATGTVYEGQLHILKLVFNQNKHPEVPPSISFMTPIWHANVDKDKICLDILNNQWSPTYNVTTIVNSMIVFLQCPNPSSPLNNAAGKDHLKHLNGELDFADTSMKYYTKKIATRKNLDNLLEAFKKMDN